MTEKASFKRALKDRLAEGLRKGSVNHATAVNIGVGGSTSVSTRQTVTQRDGQTVVKEVREERRGS
jgi:hypothetical protein